MFLVSGITGHVGGAAARILLSQGHKVRAVARKKAASEWSEKGVEVIEGDMNDPSTVAHALRGVEGAFLMMFPTMTPEPGHPQAKATIASYVKALQQAPPPKLVLLSSVGSEKSSGLGNIMQTHLMEQALGEQSFPVGIVRAGSFFENYTYALKQAAATGAFDIFLTPTDKKFPMIATEDIGHQIAKLLSISWSGKKVIELGSRVSPNDLASAVGEVLGRNISVRSVPRERWSESLQYMGLPQGSTGPYEEMLDGFNSGWIDFGIAGTEAVAGKITATHFFQSIGTSRI